MYPEYKLVQQCLRLIDEQLGWGNANTWHNEVFIELSEKIQQETRVMLSPTTLKRVWGRINYTNAPSITTLNTLAQFAGFLNWRDFKNKAGKKNSQSRIVAQKVSSNLGIIMLSASIMTIVFISFYSLRGTKNIPTIDASLIGFSSRPITYGLPNSVVFDVDLQEITSDSIYIQQYWDPSKTIQLTPGQKQATGQYYIPGYFRAKLIVDGRIIKEHDLFIKSKGWLGTLNYEPVPKYIQNKDLMNGTLSFPRAITEEVMRSEQPRVSTFHKVSEFNKVSGDNFVLETVLKNTYRDKWAVCQQVAIYILGTKSAIIVPFAIPGCISEIGIMLSDVYLSGKEHDLSGLGIDLATFRKLKIEVKDKQLRVFVENTELFSQSYQESIGNIVGFRYSFLGTGEVEHIKVTDLSGEIVLINDDFQNPK